MFPPLPEPSKSVSQDSIHSKKDPNDFTETIDKCGELALVHFFTGRNLISQRAADEEHSKTHDKNYNKELAYDDVDATKGKIMLKKYRKDNINERSKCDAQYVNNLHTYYGDGSKLKPIGNQHYAMDFVNSHANETEDQTKLKNLEVMRGKKSVENWVAKHRKLGFMHSLRRRSHSCHEFEMEIRPPTAVTIPRAKFTQDQFNSIFNIDKDFEASAGSHQMSPELRANICRSFNRLISRVNASDHPSGRMEVEKVLFSTDKLQAYLIPKKMDTTALLKDFSEKFSKWWSGLSCNSQNTFGTDKSKDHSRFSSHPYFSRVNVILSLSEFHDEGTMFRRARHICQDPSLRKGDVRRDFFLEIDTGMLRVVVPSEATVRKMPQEFAHLPTPILEVRFDGVTTQEEVTERIEEIRRTRFIDIASFDTGHRSEEQKGYYKGPNPKKWSDLMTAVIRPPKSSPSRLTTVFCGETYCMGLCCTEKYLEKSEISPTTMSTPSAWVADKREAKQRFFGEKEPAKFKYIPPPLTTSVPYQPRTNRPSQPSTSSNYPTSSMLKTEDASDFFK